MAVTVKETNKEENNDVVDDVEVLVIINRTLAVVTHTDKAETIKVVKMVTTKVVNKATIKTVNMVTIMVAMTAMEIPCT